MSKAKKQAKRATPNSEPSVETLRSTDETTPTPFPSEMRCNALRLMLADRDRRRRATARRALAAQHNKDWHKIVKDLAEHKEDTYKDNLQHVMRVLRALSGEELTPEDTKSKKALCAYTSRALRAYAERSIVTHRAMEALPGSWNDAMACEEGTSSHCRESYKRTRALNEMVSRLDELRDACAALVEGDDSR